MVTFINTHLYIIYYIIGYVLGYFSIHCEVSALKSKILVMEKYIKYLEYTHEED